jgi:hypothetical protein
MNLKKISSFYQNLSFFYFLFFFSLLFSLYHSIHWILPYLEYGDNYLPIKYGTFQYDRGGDDYFYYTYVREIVDNGILFDDPISSENNGIYSIYNTYNLTFFFASLFSIFTKNTSDIYILNYIFFSSLNFFIVGLFINFFLKNKNQCFLVTFVVLFFSPIFNFSYNFQYIKDIFLVIFDFKNIIVYPNQIYRFPTLLFTNLHIFLTTFILINFFSANFNKNYLFIISLIVVVGISPYISVHNFIITYSMIIFLLLCYYKTVFKNFFFINIIILICVLISFPGILLLLRSFFDLNIIQSINVEKELMNPIENSKEFYFFNNFFFYKELFKYFIIVTPIIFIKNDKKKIILTVVFSILFPYFFFLTTYGINFSYKIMSRGGEILLNSIIIIYYLLIYEKFFSKKNYYINKFFGYSFIASILFFVSVIFMSEIKVTNYKLKNKNFYDKDFSELTKWINSEVTERKTFLSIDPDIYINIPIYTNLDTYMHHYVIGRSTLENRVERFVRLSKYYGISEERISEILFTFNKDVNNKYYYIEETIYSQDKILSKKMIENHYIKNIIIDVIKKTNSDLKFSYDYLVTSDFDRNHISKNSLAASIVNENKLIFENKIYKVYSIKERN